MEQKLIKLKTAPGVSSTSWRGVTFLVEDGFVEVPEGAVEELIRSHGFTRPPEPKVAQSGMVPGKNPKT